jgi:alginate O-acetyltransferase complex protein AlgI
VGTSYLVFRLIAVVIDHRQGAPHGLDWLGLAAFSVFAPCSVAGPLLDSQAFHRDLRQPEPASVSSIVGALTRIVVGLAKVVVLGGTVSFLALGQVPLSGSLVRLLLAAACYSVYIYCDFSGYTDMSVGWARLWGFKVPENFDRPYLSEDLQEFWSRWHISLSLWLKRYLFYPLNLALTRHNPRGARRFNPAVALLMTFTLAGAWHGEGLGFIVFGLLHGLGVALGGPRGFRPGQALGLRGAAARLANRAATFAYVSVCWIPFVYSPSELRRQFPAGTSDLVIAAHSSQRGNGQGVPSEDRQSRRHTRSAKGVSTASPIPQPAGFE